MFCCERGAMAIDIAQQQHLSGYQRNIVSGWVVIVPFWLSTEDISFYAINLTCSKESLKECIQDEEGIKLGLYT